MLDRLRENNKELSFYNVFDDQFNKFGRVLENHPSNEAINYLEKHTSIPATGNHYVAHDIEFEKALKTVKPYQDTFGQIPLEYGYVNGHNEMLNSLEYHKSSEINVAVTSFVLMVGLVEDIKDNTYDTNQVTAFYVPKGTVIEIYPKTLHFSPCQISDLGFKCGVILPYSTNMNFIKNELTKQNEDRLLFKTNKWLLCHQEHQKFVELGAHIGLHGTNYKINY